MTRKHGQSVETGSLVVASLDIDALALESSIEYHKNMMVEMKEVGLPGQVVFHENQVIIEEKLLGIHSLHLPEILGVATIPPREGRGYTQGDIRRLKNRGGNPLRPHRYYAAKGLESYTGSNGKVIPAHALASYAQVKTDKVFDHFEVWERARSLRDARKRVGEYKLRPIVEVDPYLVGVVRFERTDRVYHGGRYGNGYQNEKTTIARPIYLLIDCWDEPEPMP
jgi:hypothetical protein